MKEYIVTYWFGPREGFMDEERIREIKDANFNLVPLELSRETNKNSLDLCFKYDLKASLFDGRISEAIKQEEGWEELLAEVVAEFGDHPALFSYHIVDEPSTEDFPALKAVCDELNKLDPNRECYINLFPNYASSQQLGADTYDEHLEKYMKTVQPTLISYDHYHFKKVQQPEPNLVFDERTNLILESTAKKSDDAGFFNNLESVRRKSLEYNTPFMVIVLLIEAGPYRNLTEAEIRWEVFQCLAYGSTRISYYTYWQPIMNEEYWNHKHAAVGLDGTLNQHYYDVQLINREIINAGNCLLGAKSEEVFHVGGNDGDVTAFRAYKEVLEAAGARVTLGFFDNGCIVAANKDFEEAGELVLTLKGGIQLQKYDKSKKVWGDCQTQNGKYLIPLAAGDGEVLRIIIYGDIIDS